MANTMAPAVPVGKNHAGWASWENRLLLLSAVLMVVFEIGVCWVGRRTSLDGRVDFKAFYCAGRLLLLGRGGEVYSAATQHAIQGGVLGLQGQTLPFLYPAFAALLFVPLALLPYRYAFVVWMLCNLVVFAVAVRLLVREGSILEGLPPAVRYLLFAVPLAVAMALMQGQITFLLLLVFVAVNRLFRRGAHFLAGLVLALALVKFQLAVPVALLFFGWRCYRVFAGFMLGAAGLSLVSVGVCGRSAMLAYGRSLLRIGQTTWVAPGAAQGRYGMFAGDMPNLHGLCFTLLAGRPAGVWMAVAASILVMLWAWRQPPSLAVALPAAMLVSYHMQAYDLVLLLVPMTLAAGRPPQSAGREGRDTTLRLHRLKLLAAALVLMSPPVAAWLLVKGLLSLLAGAVLLVLVAGADLPWLAFAEPD